MQLGPSSLHTLQLKHTGHNYSQFRLQELVQVLVVGIVHLRGKKLAHDQVTIMVKRINTYNPINGPFFTPKMTFL